MHNILANLSLDLKIKSEEKINDTLSKMIVEAGFTDNLIDTITCSTISLNSSVGPSEIRNASKTSFQNYFKVSTG